MTLRTVKQDVWWQPSSLLFQEVHVRGNTDWTTILLGDADGISGQAEITSTQLSTSVSALTARLANRLRGKRIASDDDVLQLIGIDDEALETDQLLATAVSALRCAVADALSQRASMTLSQYLRHIHGVDADGLPSSVELYGNINRSLLPDDSGPVDRSPDDFAEMAAEAVKSGFRTVKCAPFDECRAPFESTGLPECAENGLARIQAVRAAVGNEIRVFVDCHSRFDLDSALALQPELKSAGGDWFEEPVDPITHSEILRAIRERSELPIAGAEHGYGITLFRRLLQEDVLDIVMPDVKFCGGPVEAYRIGMELESILPGSVSIHCPSGPLSLLASAHATAAFSNDHTLPLEHAVYEADWRHSVLEPNERIEDGRLLLPDGLGLGARIDPALVAFKGRSWEE